MTSATVNYTVSDAAGAAHFLFDADWSGVERLPVSVEVADARTLRTPPTLDTCGFTIARLTSGVTDYNDPAQLDRLWRPAVQALICRLTGATWATCWGTNQRAAGVAEGLTVGAPAGVIHSDLSPEFDPMRIGEEPVSAGAARDVAARLGDRGPGRWRAFNVWQVLSPPPQDVPLALCDVRTISPQDLVDGHASDGTPDSRDYRLTLFRPNDAHRWYYYSDMERGDALVFSAFDPEAGIVGGRVPHTAIRPRPAPSDTVPRRSIEVRALAFFAA